MVPGVPRIPYRKVERGLLDAGFVAVRQRGSHVIFKHADGRVVVVPKHGGAVIPPGLMRRIMRDAGLGESAFR